MAWRGEVLVAGGGPAGALAAEAAASAGARVLLVEKKRRFGALPHCAEWVPRALGLELAWPARARVPAVEGCELCWPAAGRRGRRGRGRRLVAQPGWMLDRQVFDHALAARAAAAGAELWGGPPTWVPARRRGAIW